MTVPAILLDRALKLSLEGGSRLGATKTHDHRVRQIGQRVAGVLRQHLAEQDMQRQRLGGAYQNHDLVFPRPTGDPMTANAFRHRFRKAARAAGIPGMVPKDLRSTTETKQYELGWPDELVSKWQGHTSEVSCRHYVSIRGELGAKAANDLDDAMFDEEYVQSMDKTKASGAS